MPAFSLSITNEFQVVNLRPLNVLSIYPKIIEELHFGGVRRRRTAPKCDLL